MRVPLRAHRLAAAALGALALASCTIEIGAADCDVRGQRSAAVDAAGANLVRIEARAGDLLVSGKADANRVAVEGKACASDREALDSIELIAERRGDEVVVEVRIPEDRLWRGKSRNLDLEITTPSSLPVVVNDSSGDATFEGLAGLDLHDASGDLILRNLSGDVRIEDASGDVEVAQVEGSLTVSDASGDVTIDGVRGDAVVERDGSGDITARNVGKSFVVRSDGSGGIQAEDVAGDFIVDRDGSGDVEFARVAGRTPTERR